MAENRHFLITVTIILIRTKKRANFKAFSYFYLFARLIRIGMDYGPCTKSL